MITLINIIMFDIPNYINNIIKKSLVKWLITIP
jgi:hypothetical protein